MSTRPTELSMLARGCPGALRLYREGAPQDRRGFAVGTAAHQMLEALASGVGWEGAATELVTRGRIGRDAEPPLHPDDVLRGLDIVRSWVEKHGDPVGYPEVLVGIAADGTAATGDLAVIETRIDLVYEDVEFGSEGEEVTVIAGRDYKSSWRAGEDDLDSLQRRIHAVALWLAYPDAEAIRVEVAGLRTRQVYSQTLYRGTDDLRVRDWLHEVLTLAGALLADDVLPFAPGVVCLGCGYAIACPAAWSVLRDAEADPVLRYAVASGVAAACEPLAREATLETPRVLPDGGTVGYAPQQRREVTGEGVATVARAWTNKHGASAEAVHALLAAAGISATAVEGIAKALLPDRSMAAARREWVASLVEVVTSPRWGIRVRK